MEKKDCWTIGISILSLILSFLNWRMNLKNKKSIDSKSRLEIYALINKYEDELIKSENGELYDHYLQQLANSYEVVCKEYIDGLIDKSYFKDMYKDKLLIFYKKKECSEFYSEKNPDYIFDYTAKVAKEFEKY